ncbi:hypothetical protein SARC_01986 [Sphaeroforma arctica JP610]|uniref:Mitochondrial inner membrane protease subunit n=1 Tax=Sphaeroforma arctica JP610 TaxID=667725 RepID=A0A0L0GA09_9EUKA|nr:hypothetical protein SARC_01986 [Sphaeroforma arctica JP610]KNC85840.1 hypothetical protein SARC_01986 [Sphaeroforma arctica JP610]|eukprot:XP_014159742.1 hypothetical protein SARC_01986 [Sphaeroforma arctica JP610]
MSYQYLKNNVLLGVFGVTSFCFITTHVAVVLCINGNSMEPTLLDGDRVLVAKWDRPVRFDGRQSSRYNPTRGDIVVLRSPQKPKERLVKRILGFEGDVIRTRPSVDKTETVRINPGQMWIEGDNSRGSMDSNTYGQMPINLIEGRAAFILYPWGRFGRLQNRPPPNTRFVRKGRNYD